MIRPLITASLCLALSAQVALALPQPLSPEERTAKADLIIRAEVTEVTCTGFANDDRQQTSTSRYRAQLSVSEVLKGDPIDTLTLPFSVLTNLSPDQPDCAVTSDVYQVGQRGVFYLVASEGVSEYVWADYMSYETDQSTAEQSAILPLVSCDSAISGGAEAGGAEAAGAEVAGEAAGAEVAPVSAGAVTTESDEGCDATGRAQGGWLVCLLALLAWGRLCARRSEPA